MAIQHKLIPEAQLHEPKGVSTAATNQVYKSNGTGSGSWAKVNTAMIKDLSGDAGLSGKKLITNGTDGFTLATDASYGAQVITNNIVTFPLVAVVDTLFNTPAQFTLLTGGGAPWISENLFGVSFTTDRLTVPVTGVYRLDVWMNINQFTGATAKLCIRTRINGVTYPVRKMTIKGAAAADVSQLVGFDLISLTAGDYVQLLAASDVTGSIVIGDCATALQLIRQTA